MKREFLGVLLVLSLTGCAVIDASRVRQMSSLELQEAFQPCVSPLGVSRELAERKTPQLPQGRLAFIPLLQPTVISDGYVHFLHVDRERGEVYVTQVGGYAGLRTIYGPLSLRSHCVSSSRTGPVT